MSATVHLDELNPETRARVLEQISGTESGTTALATVEPKTHPFYSPAEMRARSILSRIESISAKLKTLEADIRLLWIDFDNLKAGETILGCATKKEFCEKRLQRTPRAVRYMLDGGNPANQDREEIISPVEPSILPVPAPSISAPTPMPVASTCPDCGQPFPSKGQLKRHGKTEHNIPSTGIADFLRRAAGEPAMPAAKETHWISKDNHCTTGKRGFDYPHDIWRAMRAEGAIGATDFVAYIEQCGQCGRCHRDKDQSGHKEGDVANARHQTWYRPDELNQQPEPSPQPPQPAELKPERTLEDVLDKLVERIALQPYGYSAAKFKAYPEQHTTDLAVIELSKQEIWQHIVEIGQAKLKAGIHS